MKIIIAGGREFDDYELLVNSLLYNISPFIADEIEIISGVARGADRLGERFAMQYNLKITRFPADWDKFGKSAGYKRNEQMAKYGDVLIAFWDGKSKGTKHMIDLAKKYNLTVIVINY